MRLFVYGTLKKGMPAHEVFLGNALFLGEAVTVEQYALYEVIDDDHRYPALVLWEHLYSIRGELYEVSEDDLRRIDKYEGAPVWYERVKVLVNCNGRIAEAYTYAATRRLLEICVCKRLPKGEWPL